MKTELTLETLAAALAERISPAIPIEVDYWSAAEVAALLKITRARVLSIYAPMPDFPKAYRLPTPAGGRGHPLWKAAEVVRWVEKYYT